MEKQLKENKRSPRKRIVNFLVHVLLAVLALIWVMPIVWIVLTSFRAEPGAYTNTFLPKAYTLNNYVKLLTDRNVLNFPRMFKNTLIIAICSCCISTSFVLSVSYSLSRMRFKFRKPYMNIAMILGLFPGFMTMIAQYFILKAMGLTEGSSIRFGLIIVYSACTGLGFQISKGFFDTISKQIDEAAMIDGATKFQIFYKITIPLSKPIITYTVLTSFMSPWAEYITANYMLGGQNLEKSNWTLPLILYKMLNAGELSDRPRYWGQFCAGAVIIAIPTSLLFMVMQKNYVGGVTGGAVKG